MKPLTDEQRQAILDEIIAATAPRVRQRYQFTRQEYQDRAGIAKSTAQRALKKAIDTGILKRERLLVDDRPAFVFWRPEDEP